MCAAMTMPIKEYHNVNTKSVPHGHSLQSRCYKVKFEKKKKIHTIIVESHNALCQQEFMCKYKLQQSVKCYVK